jgi:hypothetical protein
VTRLRRAAFLALGLHLIAGISMAFILARGLETNPDLQDRMAFLVNHRIMWTAAWLTWTAAGPAILYFYAAFADAHPASPKIAVYFTIAALAPDLGAQAIEIGVLPGITSPEMFLTLSRTATMLSGYLANGLYTLTALMLVWASRGAYPKWVSVAGFTVAVAGFALSLAVLIGSVPGMFWTNVVLVPALLIWLTGVADTDHSGNVHGTHLPCND